MEDVFVFLIFNFEMNLTVYDIIVTDLPLYILI